MSKTGLIHRPQVRRVTPNIARLETVWKKLNDLVLNHLDFMMHEPL